MDRNTLKICLVSLVSAILCGCMYAAQQVSLLTRMQQAENVAAVWHMLDVVPKPGIGVVSLSVYWEKLKQKKILQEALIGYMPTAVAHSLVHSLRDGVPGQRVTWQNIPDKISWVSTIKDQQLVRQSILQKHSGLAQVADIDKVPLLVLIYAAVVQELSKIDIAEEFASKYNEFRVSLFEEQIPESFDPQQPWVKGSELFGRYPALQRSMETCTPQRMVPAPAPSWAEAPAAIPAAVVVHVAPPPVSSIEKHASVSGVSHDAVPLKVSVPAIAGDEQKPQEKISWFQSMNNRIQALVTPKVRTIMLTCITAGCMLGAWRWLRPASYTYFFGNPFRATLSAIVATVSGTCLWRWKNG